MLFMSKRGSIIITMTLIAITAAALDCHAQDLAAQTNIYLYPNPQNVSEFKLKTLDGRAVSLNDYRGRVTLLHFWSISCPACKIEEPLLKELKKNMGPMGLEILGVNLVDPPPAIRKFNQIKRSPYPILVGGGLGFNLKSFTVAGKQTAYVINPANEAILEVPGLPTTYIIDCSGNAVGFSVGVARWNHQLARNLLNGLLKDTRSCRASVSPAKRGAISLAR
jgi:thiol-disulfide isomerase/thioredoxin